jgi:uncharacterized protein
MSEEDFEALEEALVSGDVPEDCMDLEMLDGFLAAILISPRPIAVDQWLPTVWSADETADPGGGQGVQRAIRLVLAYYNELVTTLGRDAGECWEPFCFAPAEDDELGLGDEWAMGFAQGLGQWPEDSMAELPEDIADATVRALEDAIAPWAADDAAGGDEETRLGWLAAAGEAVNDAFARWRDLELPAPQPIAAASPEPFK